MAVVVAVALVVVHLAVQVAEEMEVHMEEVQHLPTLVAVAVQVE